MEAEKFILLLCTDNDHRQEGEEMYQNMDFADKLGLLLEALCYTKADNVVETAGVRLRQFLATEFMAFHKGRMDGPHTQLLHQVLRALDQPTAPTARKIVCKVIAELAEKLIGPDGNNQWTELPTFLLSCASSKRANLQLAALHIFAAAPALFATEEMQELTLINQLFTASLDPQADMAVRHQAVHAIGVFIQNDGEVEQPVLFKEFSDLLPKILIAIRESIQARSDVSFLVWLKDIAYTCPQFLRPKLGVVFDFCTETFCSQDPEDIWRKLALEVMVALSEQASAAVRKSAAHSIAALMPHLLEMLKDLEDDENWHHSDVVGEGRHHTIAKSSLDRLACALGGAVVLPLVMQALPTLISHSAWQQRYAGLTAIGIIAEGCRKEMQPMLDKIVWSIEASLYDPHPRIRYTACNTVGQMAKDFMPTFARKFHKPIVSGLLSVIQNRNNPRVQAHAGAAFASFCEYCPKKTLVRYLDAIMPLLMRELYHRLVDILAMDSALVLENMIHTIARVAKTSEEEFVLYYDELMPVLKTIMKNATPKVVGKLCDRTIECISFIGLAVGPAKFMAEAVEIMTMSLSQLPNDDCLTPFVFGAWSRLSKTMGNQFNSYLPLIMGPVLSKAAIKPSAVYSDNEQVEQTKGDVHSMFVDTDRHTQLAISTPDLEQKVAATSLLLYFSRAPEIDLKDYVDEAVRIMVSCLKFYVNHEVRSAAAASLPYLLNCAATKGRDHLERLWLYICPELPKAFHAELVIEVQSQILHSLDGCIDSVGYDFVFKSSIQEVLEILTCAMTELLTRSDKRIQARNAEDHDEFAEEILAEQTTTDAYALSKVADIIHAFFKNKTIELLSYFSQVSPFFARLMDPGRHWQERLWGLTVYGAMLEMCGPACVEYKQVISESFLASLEEKEPDIQIAAANGCGDMAQNGGEAFADTCAQATVLLMQMVNDPKSREPNSIRVTQNGMEALTKILKFNNSALPYIDKTVMDWFTWLPVIQESNIAAEAYSYLCDLVDNRHPSILGHSSQVVATITDVFAAGVIQPRSELGERLMGVADKIRLQ